MTNWRGPGVSGGTTSRLRLRPWRDPRLILGVLLVLTATVLGARLAAAGDDRVSYWSVRSTVTAGDTPSRSDLVPTRLHLSGAVADNYVRADEELPAPLDELVWSHELRSGSLLARSSLVGRSTRDRVQLPLSVTDGSAPADLSRGDLVDVWVGPEAGDRSGAAAARVLEGVRVLQAGDGDAVAGGALSRTVLVDVAEGRLVPEVVTTVGSGRVTLVRVS